MLKIRRPLGRLIFNMGIAIPGKTVFLIETAPSHYLKQWWLGLLTDIEMAVSTRVVFDFTHLREPDLFLIQKCNISYTKATGKSLMKSKISLYLVVENMALSRDINTDSFFFSKNNSSHGKHKWPSSWFDYCVRFVMAIYKIDDDSRIR